MENDRERFQTLAGVPEWARGAVRYLFDRYFDGYDAGGGEAHKTLAMVVPSVDQSNRYGWGLDLNDPRLGRVFEVFNQKFEGCVDVPLHEIIRGLEGVQRYRDEMISLGSNARGMFDSQLAHVMEHGETDLGYDGRPFFGVHPLAPNLFYENRLYGVDVAQAFAVMAAYKGEDSQRLEVKPTHLVVHPERERWARKQAGPLEVVVFAHLHNPDPFYVACCNRAVKPLLVQVRQAPEPSLDQRGWEVSITTNARCAAGYGLPFLMIKATSEGKI